MTVLESLPDQSRANDTMLRLSDWTFAFDNPDGSIVVTSPDGIPYFYDQGCAEKAIADAMAMHQRSVAHRYVGSFARAD